MGFHPVVVYLRKSTWLHAVEALLPPGSYVEILDSTLSLNPFLAPRGTLVGFADFRLRPFELAHCESLAIRWLLTTWGPSAGAIHWTSTFVDVSHQAAGGVTTHTMRIHRWHLRTSPVVNALRQMRKIPRDASTILSAAAFAKGTRRCPTHRRVFPLSSLNLGSVHAPIWHSGGLLPARPNRRTGVLTPCLGLPTDLWGIRRLSQTELLHALDFNDSAVSAITDTELVFSPDFWAFALPGKCLLAGFEALCASRGFVPAPRTNEGGISIPPVCKSDNSEWRAEVSRSKRHSMIEIWEDEHREARQTDQDPNMASTPMQPELGKRRRSSGDSTKYSTLFATTHGVKSPKDEYTAWFLANKLQDLSLGAPKLNQEEAVVEDNNKGHANQASIQREMRERKATKSDDAEVPEYLWLEHLIEDAPASMGIQEWSADHRAKLPNALKVLRRFGLRRWRRNVLNSFRTWVHGRQAANPISVSASRVLVCHKQTYCWSATGKQTHRKWHESVWRGLESSQKVASDAINRAMGATWWAWDQGSTPFFWRWPREYEDRIRDGVPVYFKKQPPLNRKPQRDAPDAHTRKLMIEKLRKVRQRRYIIAGLVESLTNFFSVDKGPIDIRMVYDGSASGLNDAIWVPGFGLPTIDTHLRAVDGTTFMGDIDIGEMFLNFPLHESIQPYAGVDFTRYFAKRNSGILWERWCRCAMGLTSSPYLACQGMGFAEEVIRGNRHDPENVYRWKIVRLNLPGQPDYDPSLPWVAKMRDLNGSELAADFFIFVDDVRPCGPSKAEAWRAARRAASTINWLGLQDAARKRRDSSQQPGAWTGSIVRTTGTDVYLLCSQEKWDKAKKMIREVQGMIRKDRTSLDRHRLEVIRGFLNYIFQTYHVLKPFLIGFHMTIDSWRGDRDREGWKRRRRVNKEPDSDWLKGDEPTQDKSNAWNKLRRRFRGLVNKDPPPYGLEAPPPQKVTAVPRLAGNVEALLHLMNADKPPLKKARCSNKACAYYGFGDASGTGFGASFEVNGEILFQYGQWSLEVTEDTSSNWKELANLVQGVKKILFEYKLTNCELFIFTDNTTAEGAFWKGTAKSPRLFELMLELMMLELEHSLIIHVVHVSGDRMRSQGTDGLSPADHTQGVMGGASMQSFIPLHLSALDRDARVKTWLTEITKGLGIKFLNPEGWFDDAHSQGNFIWTPPPAAAEVVVEQLAKARHKRPECFHLIIVPRLMTGRWRRKLIRGCDGYFRLLADDVWPARENFEPLMIFVCLPFHSWNPMHSERSKVLERIHRVMFREDMSEIFGKRRRDILRKLFATARNLCTV